MIPFRTLAVAGAGSIGVAFAVLFAKSGYQVRIWDLLPETFDRARNDFMTRLSKLADYKLLDEDLSIVADRVKFEPDLGACVAGSLLVQECIPEELEIKRDFFSRVAALTDDDCVLASSTSFLQPSLIAEGVPAADRLLVAHPGNPPYLLPIIELVPSPRTAPSVLATARALYEKAGLRPILVKQEVEGFVFNRLQGALLREAYCLVRDGVADVDDIDTVVREGLGARWSVIGPFETADLNTRGGIGAHADRMGPSYARMGAERGQHDPWTSDLVAKVVAQRRALLPHEAWEGRVIWRDEQLMAQRRRKEFR